MNEYLLLIPNNIKNEVIKKSRNLYYNYNIKYMSLEEFIKKVTFDYDTKTIYYLMKKYDIKYDIALMYLDNLYYINDSLDNKKMFKLKEIKKYLDDNNLLLYNQKFTNYIKDKQIYIYGYSYINKYQERILAKYSYQIIDSAYQTYPINKIYYTDYIDDEVIFVANKISHLLKDGVSIQNIKIIASNEYINVLDRIFKLYQIPISSNKKSIYSVYEVKKILNNLNTSLEEVENIQNIKLLTIITNILNKYSFISDKKEVRMLIEEDFKNTYISDNEESIKIINLFDYIDDNDYVFLMGFNKENFPKIYKDDDYFNDIEKDILELDTSSFLNSIQREITIRKIQSIKNLTITYKLYDSSLNYTKSDLFDNICEEKINNNDYTNSHLLNKVLLTLKLDKLIKYNVKEKDLDLLYSNYLDIPYLKYDNKYHQIAPDKLYKYLKNNLVLAYTSFDNYNKCKFKYYLNHILGINIIKDDFAMLIGNICHYLLSNIDNNDFDVSKYFDDYLAKQRNFTSREKFFLQNIKEEMFFIVDTIKKQLTYTSFDKKLYEEKVYIDKSKNIKVTFMGVIDKVLYKEEGSRTYLVVIDYKTGNTDIKLNNMAYGIGMQLPIYLYLSSNMNFKNVQVVGFYLQKLLSSSLDNTKDYDEARENSLKLEGYSINNEQILSKFDKTYNNSKLIKGMKTSSKGFYSYSKVLSNEEIDSLITSTNEQIDSVINSILKADFTINPKIIDGENISCKYCDYQDICFRRESDVVYINREKESKDEEI